MNGLIIFAAVIASLAFFSFFGNAYSNTGGKVIPNMFHLMFGGKQTYEGYEIAWKRFDGLTFLFILELVIIILTITIIIIIANDSDEQVKMFIVRILLALSFTNSILSTLLVSITNTVGGFGENVQLGFGPIFYTVIQMISVILYCIALINHYREATYSANYNRRYTYRNTSQTSNPVSSQPATKPTMTEEAKVDLIIKYKKLLDEEVITQEEFEEKKRKIL